MFWRLHAQRLLVERGKADVVPALVKLVADESVDETGLNAGAVHAAWTLAGLGAGKENAAALLAAVKHPSAAVRQAIWAAIPRSGQDVADQIFIRGA